MYINNETVAGVQQSRKERKQIKIMALREYLQSRYGITLSKEFEEVLVRDSNIKIVIPKKIAVKAVIREWKIWQPYVEDTPHEFAKFVENELKSLATIQATATFSSPKLKGYLGRKVKVQKALPPRMSTTVNIYGVLSVDGVTQ